MPVQFLFPKESLEHQFYDSFSKAAPIGGLKFGPTRPNDIDDVESESLKKPKMQKQSSQKGIKMIWKAKN